MLVYQTVIPMYFMIFPSYSRRISITSTTAVPTPSAQVLQSQPCQCLTTPHGSRKGPGGLVMADFFQIYMGLENVL
jgi:hypothetical protein